MSRSVGLDLGGYTSGAAALAFAELGRVTVWRGHSLNTRFSLDAPAQEVFLRESHVLRGALEWGDLYVDVPVDLQGLEDPDREVRFLWELYRRPIDRALKALPPLTDRLGYVARRFRAASCLLGDDERARIFETYPAFSLRNVGLESTGYKGRAKMFDRWRPETDSTADARLARLLNLLGARAEPGLALTHDEFDAVVAGLTGVTSSLRGDALRDRVASILSEPRHARHAPDAFAVWSQAPEPFQLCVSDKMPQCS